jgi:hypothetical protein
MPEEFHETNTYKFLVKPVFFIISLLIVGYLILRLENLKPQDVGLNKQMGSEANKTEVKAEK